MLLRFYHGIILLELLSITIMSIYDWWITGEIQSDKREVWSS